MSLVGEQVLLRIYLQSADRAPHAPTYERIIKVARNEKLAGATVIRGILGVGNRGIIPASNWSVVEHVPGDDHAGAGGGDDVSPSGTRSAELSQSGGGTEASFHIAYYFTGEPYENRRKRRFAACVYRGVGPVRA